MAVSQKIKSASQVENILIKNILYNRKIVKTKKLYLIGKKILNKNIKEFTNCLRIHTTKTQIFGN